MRRTLARNRIHGPVDTLFQLKAHFGLPRPSSKSPAIVQTLISEVGDSGFEVMRPTTQRRLRKSLMPFRLRKSQAGRAGKRVAVSVLSFTFLLGGFMARMFIHRRAFAILRPFNNARAQRRVASDDRTLTSTFQRSGRLRVAA